MFAPKAIADEDEIMKPVCLSHQCNQSIHVTYGVTVTSFSNSLQHKTSMTKYHVCQIVLIQTLSCIIYGQTALNQSSLC